jgi:hypothetical protein
MGTTAAVFYVPVRAVSGLFTTSGVTAGRDLSELRSFLPHSRQQVLNADGTMNSAWYRFFQVFVDVFLGGAGAYTLADIVAAVNASEERSAQLAAMTQAVADQSQTNAEALSAVVQVAQNNALAGADQIPPVRLSNMEMIP